MISIFVFHIGNSIRYISMVSANQTTQSDVLNSPFFPNFYPRDLSVEHVIECSSNDSSECHIEITFTDFQLAIPSVMEVNSQHFLANPTCFTRCFLSLFVLSCSAQTNSCCNDLRVKSFGRQSFSWIFAWSASGSMQMEALESVIVPTSVIWFRNFPTKQSAHIAVA